MAANLGQYQKSGFEARLSRISTGDTFEQSDEAIGTKPCGPQKTVKQKAFAESYASVLLALVVGYGSLHAARFAHSFMEANAATLPEAAVKVGMSISPMMMTAIAIFFALTLFGLASLKHYGAAIGAVVAVLFGGDILNSLMAQDITAYLPAALSTAGS